MRYQYLNLDTENSTSSVSHLTARERRNQILHDPEQYLVAVDRFTIHKVWLPVFQETETLTVRIVKKSDSSNHDTDVDFSGLVDSDGFMYTIDYFLNAVNSAISASAVSAGILVADVPFITLDRSTWLATLDYDAHANFGDDFYLEFNEPLFSHFPHFRYADILPTTTYFRVYTPNSGTKTTTTADEILTSPVDKIYIKTHQVPVVGEYTSALDSNPTDKAELILTDFEFGGSNRFCIQNIGYTATTGQYRWHNMYHGAFHSADISFYFKTYNNERHPLRVGPSGSISAKLVFKEV